MKKSISMTRAIISRRKFLAGMAATALCSILPVSLIAAEKGAASIPILMFHKVDDTPRYPEDITSTQLEILLDKVWALGFRPVNMSDILEGRVDSIVQSGCIPVGITADDAHRSIVFSTSTVQHPEQRNARSFMDIFAASVQPYACEARATLFLGAVGDDRVSKEPAGYFGHVLPLAEILDRLSVLPGLEFGYHTRTHTRMNDMGAHETRALLEDQVQDFQTQGVLERIQRILAYPYGVPPSSEGIEQLQKMGFKGAVQAFPGLNEARYTTVPQCFYEKGRVTDLFHIPRICIGAYTYAQEGSKSAPYLSIDPMDDFTKDVVESSNLYVSQGACT